MYKFWNRHMIPWCFHVVGNPNDHRDFSSSSSASSFRKQEHQALAAAAEAVKKRKTKTEKKKKKKKKKKSKSIIKVIKSDGIVTIYRRHIHVSELMLEFPKHMVCRSDSFYIGQKIPAMSEKEKLQMGHNYFLLPMHCFQSVLSLVNIASSFSSSNANRPPNANVSSFIINKAAAAAAAALPPNCQAFDIQKTASGYLNLRVSDDFISQLIHTEEEEEEDEDEEEKSRSRTGRLCSTDELEKEYTQLVGCRRRGNWKPKLETIRENHTSKTKKNKNNNKKKKKKKFHPKLSSFFIIKKIRKKRNKNKLSSTSTSNSAHKTTSSSDSPPPPPPPPPPPKSKKMKFMRSSKKY